MTIYPLLNTIVILLLLQFIFRFFSKWVLVKSPVALLIIVFVSPSSSAETFKAGQVFRDCPVCPEMVAIPTGKFAMGSNTGKVRERPLTPISIKKFIAIGKYELTFDEWDVCYKMLGCSTKPEDRGWGRGRRPVININYKDIKEYLVWITKKTQNVYRLPSEAEWEYSNRAGTNTEYWWGNNMVLGSANCRNCGTPWSGINTSPVGQFRPNYWGLYDTHGNVFEIVSDCWTPNHSNARNDGAPVIIKNCNSRVIKGGAWYYLPKVARSASRARNDDRVFSYVVGVRIAREIK